MAENQYTLMVNSILRILSAALIGPDYGWPSSLVLSARVYKEASLPAFDRYCIIISPNPRPWDEQRQGVPKIQYIFRADLYLLVKNYHESKSLLGSTAPDLGIFQLVHDVKEVLRSSSLDDLISASIKSYDETAAPVDFNSFTTGFDSSEKMFVHRAKLLYQTGVAPFCHSRL